MPETTPTEALQKTFMLRVPVSDDKGVCYDRLTVVEPELHHEIKMQKAGGGSSGGIALLALLAGVPAEVIPRLKTRDAAPINAWLASLRAPVDGDPVADVEGGEASATFQLLAPIVVGEKMISSVTLAEPTLAAGIAVEKFKTEAEQMVALIASCSLLSIPEVNRLRRRDADRVERWLAPFLAAGSPSETPSPDAPAATSSSAAGETSPPPSAAS